MLDYENEIAENKYLRKQRDDILVSLQKIKERKRIIIEKMKKNEVYFNLLPYDEEECEIEKRCKALRMKKDSFLKLKEEKNIQLQEFEAKLNEIEQQNQILRETIIEFQESNELLFESKTENLLTQNAAPLIKPLYNPSFYTDGFEPKLEESPNLFFLYPNGEMIKMHNGFIRRTPNSYTKS